MSSYSVRGDLLTAFSQIADERSQCRFRIDGDTRLLQDCDSYVVRLSQLPEQGFELRRRDSD